MNFFGNQLEFSGDMDETGFGIHPLLKKCETLRLQVRKLNNVLFQLNEDA